jgi:hypothetical protein
VVAPGLFVTIIVSQSARLMMFGGYRHRTDSEGRLPFTFVGCYLSFMVSLAAVYDGMQTVQLFFLLAGWADGLLTCRVRAVAPAAVSAQPDAARP